MPKTKYRKQQEAKERQLRWNALSTLEKIAELNQRPGTSKKQRTRLQRKGAT